MPKIKNISRLFFVEKNKKPFTRIGSSSFETIRKPEKTKNKLQTIISMMCKPYLENSKKNKSFFFAPSENKKQDIDIQKTLETYKEYSLRRGQVQINGVYVDALKMEDYLKQQNYQSNYIYTAKSSKEKITNLPETTENPGPHVLCELLKKRLSKLLQEDHAHLDREACKLLIKENLDYLQKKLIENENCKNPFIFKK